MIDERRQEPQPQSDSDEQEPVVPPVEIDPLLEEHIEKDFEPEGKK